MPISKQPETRAAVLAMLADGRPYTGAEMMRAMGMTKTTLARALHQLVADGLIKRDARRKDHSYSINNGRVGRPERSHFAWLDLCKDERIAI